MPIGVMLVDDLPDIRMLWRLYIEQANDGLHVVGEADNGPDVLSSDIRADAYVIDLMMPGMTGLELATQLRASGRTEPAILCSAYISEEVRARAGEVGIDACLEKADMASLPQLIIDLTRP